MATPHVAGIAAHPQAGTPELGRADVKAALSASTVPVARRGCFDAGSGRVDALGRSDRRCVTAPTSTWVLRLAARRPRPTSTPSRTRTSDHRPSRCALAVGFRGRDRDGARGHPRGRPCDGPRRRAGVGRRNRGSDAREPGSYSGVVTATVEGGSSQTVRTAVGYQLEPERYDLTVSQPAVGDPVGLARGLARRAVRLLLRRAGAGRGAGSAGHLPGAAQKYSATVVSYGQAADDSSQGVLDVRPFLDVHHNTSVLVDENTSRRFGNRTGPSSRRGRFGDVCGVVWPARRVQRGRHLRPVRPGVRPSDGERARLDGERPAVPTAVSARGRAAPGRRGTIGLRPVPRHGGAWLTPVPRVSGSHTGCISAGSTSHLVTGRVRGALALVSVSRGACPDLRATARTLKAAGAVGLITYPGHGQTCVGTLASTPVLPTFQARPVDGHRLKARSGHPASVVSHSRPEYVDDLATGWTLGACRRDRRRPRRSGRGDGRDRPIHGRLVTRWSRRL